MKSLFSHWLNLISLTWRLVFYFWSAASKTYFPDMPLLFGRRSEVHLSGRGRSSAPISFTSRVWELCTREPVHLGVTQSRSVQMYRQIALLAWKRCKPQRHGKNGRQEKQACTSGYMYMTWTVCHRGEPTQPRGRATTDATCTSCFCFFARVGEVSRGTGGEMKSWKFPSG